MAKVKRARGRPARPLPPRIDATPEQVARTLLQMPPPKETMESRTYSCASCGRAVTWPDILYDDQRCESCHAAS